MSSTLKPDTAEQVAEAVAWAVSEEAPIEVLGGGARRTMGRAVQAEHTIDLSGLTGITLYEPEELVLSARAATPIAEIHQALREKNQELAFEPADYSRLLGEPEGSGTIGGVLACNLSGPRRIKAGAARDHFLGVHAVSGRGEAFKSGGRVVKNVTGYDMCKGLAGSWGTLAVMTDVTVKVLPAADTEVTVLILGLDDEAACSAMSAALQTSYEVSSCAHLPAGLAALSAVSDVAGAGQSVTAVRVEGITPSVSYRVERLKEVLSGNGTVAELSDGSSRSLWKEVCDVHFLADGMERPVWRLSVPPMSGAGVVAAIAEEHGVRAYYDWAGGLIWLDLEADVDAGAQRIREAVAAAGGHATLVRASAPVRAAVDVFQPQSQEVAMLSRRLKDNFDPKGILNPGRMYADR